MAQNLEPILTIAIPTYNRKNELEQCLRCIIPQLNSRIKVIVRDNCSEYDAELIVSKFKSPFIHFIKNTVNIGGDANIARLFEYCDTDWLWVLGDDDYLLPDSVTRVLKCIDENKEVIYIKYNSPYIGKTKGLNGFLKAMEPRSAFANSFFTSECIYRIKGCENDIFYHYKYLSCMCGQIVRIIYHLMEKEDECLFLPDRLLEIHGAEISWNRLNFVLSQGLLFDLMLDNKKLMKDNIIKDYGTYSLHYIDSAKVPFSKKLYTIKLLISRLGFWYILKNHYPQLFRIPLVRILPSSVYKKLRNFVMK